MKPKYLFILITLFVVASGTTAGAQGLNSPVGTWEITVSGKDKGNAFMTFNADSTLSGYAITVSSFGLLIFDGTWSYDGTGRIVGSFTAQVNGQSSLVNFIGTVKNGTKLQLSALGGNGSVKLKGIPAGALPNLTGHYIGYANDHVQKFTEDLDLSPGIYPGVYDISGSASLGFHLTGALIVSSRNTVYVYALTDYGAVSSLAGKGDPIKGTGKLKGIDTYGVRISIALVRQ